MIEVDRKSGGISALNRETYLGKVFRAADGELYGVIRHCGQSVPDELKVFGGETLASDDCGNYFIVSSDAIYFWDHETAQCKKLAQSLDDFILGCIAPDVIDLPPQKVVSVWVDPSFAQSLGMSLSTNNIKKHE